MCETSLITLESLIKAGEQIKDRLIYDTPPANVYRYYDRFILEDENSYYNWKERSLRYLRNNSKEDVAGFVQYATEFEKLYLPRYITNMISLLRACYEMPTEKQMRKSQMNIMDEDLHKMEILEAEYLAQCNGGRDTYNLRETIEAFHRWYSFASVLFDRVFYANDDLSALFNGVDTSGNGYTLHAEYTRINAVYCKLIARIKERRNLKFNTSIVACDNKSSITSRSNQVNIFISYAHADIKWLNRLKIHLKALGRLCNNVAYWEDTQINTGDKWRSEINDAIDRANVAILLVSADFLASDFIANNELPPLLKKAEMKGCRIMPLIVAPCTFELSDLSCYQAVNSPETSLTDLGTNEAAIERVYLDLIRSIHQDCN